MPQANHKNSVNRKNRRKISREYKKIRYLNTPDMRFEFNQLQEIVKDKRGNTTIMPANSHLLSLLDKVVYEWFQRAQTLIETGPITDEMFLHKAIEASQIFGVANLVLDYEWVRLFRKTHNITNLDMTMLRIDNVSGPHSADINEVVMYVLANNPISEYLADSNYQSICDPQISRIPIASLPYSDPADDDNPEYIISDSFDQPAEVQIEVLSPAAPVITNDEQARQHLKPLEEYVLLTENFRAIGLLTQLEEIFAAQSVKCKEDV